MRLRTKLVLMATGLTFGIVLILSVLFLGQLLRQRIEQTAAANEVNVRGVLLATELAVRTGLNAHPLPADTPPDQVDEALHTAVLDALRSNDDLLSLMDGLVRYAPTVEDVSITDAHGFTMLSTDPDALNQRAPYRDSFSRLSDGNVFFQMREVFGKPKVLDVAKPLDRNNMPFLVVHIGVRSSFLRNAYEPFLRAALQFVLIATLASMVVAAFLSAVALRPLQVISEQLDRLSLSGSKPHGSALPGQSPLLLDQPSRLADPIGRVTRSIDRLGRQMRSQEEGYTALQANLNQMLDTLRDGVLLFTPDRRAVMVSDAVAHFIPRSAEGPEAPAVEDMVGMRIEQIFLPQTRLGAAVLAAFDRGAQISSDTVTVEDGRQVQISLDHIGSPRGNGRRGSPTQEMGTLLTLRDTGSAIELEQELEVARRLAAIGRLTANVGHEVKNPINAMVVHLELLRGKLSAGHVEADGARKHVEILTDEMHRLDRVVQTLADFSRPMELDLREHDLIRVIDQTLELVRAELKEHNVSIESEIPARPVPVRIDDELMRQAFLNLLLNAMQAMPAGGIVRVTVRREQRFAFVEIADTGVGIPAALLPRIFDLYFTTKPKGSGIGLAMTYRIVQLHGGTMEVRSDSEPASPARGTAFTLQIPISNASSKESRDVSNDAEAAQFDLSDSVTTTMENKEAI